MATLKTSSEANYDRRTPHGRTPHGRTKRLIGARATALPKKLTIIIIQKKDFRPNIFLTSNLFGPTIFSRPKIFSDIEFIWTQNFLLTQDLLWTIIPNFF